LGWPSLSDRRKSIKLKNFIKIIDKEAPQYLQNLLPIKIGVNRPESRHADDFLPVAARTETFKNSFIPASVKLWNELEKENRNLTYCKKLANGPRKYRDLRLYFYGSRSNNVKHSQLRMKCSKLKAHLYFSLHVIDCPLCICGGGIEDVSHYLLKCPFYTAERRIMIQEISPLIENVSIKSLLHCSDTLDINQNKLIFNAVHRFIETTKRLK
jgi:hypothetical protein